VDVDVDVGMGASVIVFNAVSNTLLVVDFSPAFPSSAFY
jgi:hypothetical protein